MKYLSHALLISLAIGFGPAAYSQTFQQAAAAYEHRDYVVALTGFKILADQGDKYAQEFLGLMYEEGQGVAKDEQQAAMWYRKSAEQGSAGAQNSLGLMYESGRGVPTDYYQAAQWFRKAAEQGDAHGQYKLGYMYAQGRGVPQDDRQAAAWFLKAAEQGNVWAQYSLGVIYSKGDSQDDRQAFSWYRKAAEQGYAEAQVQLGGMFVNGQGVPKDLKQAELWFRKAAAQGHAAAQRNVADLERLALIDKGDSPDSRLAAQAKTAAEQGNVEAQRAYGISLKLGRGVPQDKQAAVVWYRRAADQGDDIAQTLLGNSYKNGDGVPQDPQKGAYWLRKAAEQGNGQAQLLLGTMYHAGLGVPKDDQMSYFWILLARSSGNKDAERGLEVSGGLLTQEQRVTVQTLARNWRPTTAAESIRGDGVDGDRVGSNKAGRGSVQPDSTGSGWRVARGAIVTNHHVVNGCSRLSVNGVAAEVRSSDARSDLALLNSTVPGPSANVRARRVAVGEPVAVAGYPLRGLLSGFNMTTGTLSSLSGMGGDTSLVQITAPVQPGNSGGPVLDSAGNLMGVVVSKLDAIKAAKITGDIPQNVNFAINANVLRSFLDANSVEYDTASSDKALPTTAIAEKAKGFTVLVECWK